MKNKSSIFLAIVIVVLLSPLLAGSAQAIDTGLTSYKGPGVEVYLTSSAYVSTSEVAFVINYETTDAILKVTGSGVSTQGLNRTYLTQVIEARTSQIIEINFADVQVSYTVSIERAGVTVFSVEKSRPAFYLPTPRDSSQWHLAPPTKLDPLKYTEAAVNSIIASITLQVVIIAIVIIGLGAALGALVKQITRFLVPIDFISMLVIVIVIIDILLKLDNGIFGNYDKVWNVALLVGYQIGFWLWRIDYLTPIRTNLREKTFSALPIPYYYPDSGEGCCLATQTNRALFKRLILGIHHPLGTDAGIAQDWQFVGKKPYLPKIHVRSIWVEKEIITETRTKWWIFTVSRYKTEYKLAYASGIQKAQFLVYGKAYFKIQEMYENLAFKYTELRLVHKTEAIGSSASMIEASALRGPAFRFAKFFGAEPTPIDLETGESTLNVIEKAEVEPQAGVDEYQPEQQDEDQERQPDRDQDSKKKRNKGTKTRQNRQKKNQQDDDDLGD